MPRISRIPAGGGAIATEQGYRPRSVKPDSGISRWTFDNADTETGTALDSWNGYDGAISGATTGATGHDGEAYSFDETDDYVDFGDVTEINGASQFTATAWVYNQTGASSYGMILSKSNDGGGTSSDNAFQLFKDNTSSDHLRFAVGDGSTEYDINVDGALPQDTWTMATGVYDGSDLVLYADDTEVGRNNIGSITVANSTVSVLAARRGDGLYFGGRIDDPRLYNKGLTATEVSNLYSTGSISG